MASRLNDIEQKLNEIFAENAPELPASSKRFIVQWLPIVAVVLGILSLIVSISLWKWAHSANDMVDHMNTLCQASGTTPHCGVTSVNRFSLWLWLGLMALIVQGILYVLAYSNLRDRKRQGWNYLFYGGLLSVAYAFVILLSAYGGLGDFLGSLIVSVIGFYLLFQVRSFYNGVVEPKRVEPVFPGESAATAPKKPVRTKTTPVATKVPKATKVAKVSKAKKTTKKTK